MAHGRGKPASLYFAIAVEPRASNACDADRSALGDEPEQISQLTS
jgi:hypothetical protein